MKLPIRLFVFLCVAFSHLISYAQESTNYFFLGNIYYQDADGQELRLPYLPVMMARRDNPDKIIAVSMTNSVGTVSFLGIPMDISKDYIFTLDLPSGQKRFLFTGIANPSFKGGNVSIHMRLDKHEKYLTLQRLAIAKGQMDTPALDIATSAIKGASRKGVNITNSEGLSYRIFLRGRPVQDKKIEEALQSLTGSFIENIVISHPIEENDYFAGAIDFITTIGKPLSIEKTTYSLERLP